MSTNGKTNGAKNLRQRMNDLPRLAEVLQGSDGFALHFVVYDAPETLKEITEQLSTTYKIPLQSFDLSKYEDPLQSLVKTLATAPEKSRFAITGLPEAVMPTPTDFRLDILENLNLRLFDMRRLNHTMIFFMPIDFLEYVREDASDMWEWRANLFMFQQMDQDRFRLAHYLVDHFANSDSAETHSKKHNLSAVYRALNIEYEDDNIDLVLKYNLMGKTAALHYRMGEYQESIDLLNQQMDLAMLIGNETFFPEILNNLGKLHEARGNYEEALTFMKQAATIGEKKLRGDNHPAKMIITANIGDVMSSLGELQDAYQHCRKALRMGENKLGMRHASLIPIIMKLGNVLRKQKRFDDALDYFRRALQIVESRLKIEHPYASFIMQNIGMTYYNQNKLEMARRYVYRTLEMAERTMGPEHPYMGLLLNDVGLTHFHTDNGDTALKYFNWAIDIRSQKVAPDDFTVGTIHSNIARVYQTQGKYQQAQDSFRKTLDIYKAKLSKAHPFLQQVQESIYTISEAMSAE